MQRTLYEIANKKSTYITTLDRLGFFKFKESLHYLANSSKNKIFKFSRFAFIQLFHNNIETGFKRYYPLVSRYDDVNVSFKELYDNITLYNPSDCTDIPLGYISKKEKQFYHFDYDELHGDF